jgi:formylglycine-generating enzyme required for sulfatase activity
VETENSIGIRFVLIPPGEFLMGSAEQDRERLLEETKASEYMAPIRWKRAIDRIPSEGPQHRVRITRPFYLGKYEVTQAQWQAVIGSNPSQFKDAPSHPVEQVSWEDIQLFLEKLRVASTLRLPAGESPSTGKRLQFALPTEVQWEYACRGGTKTFWYDGNTEESLRESGWYRRNSDSQTHPVGQLKANAWGLCDMHGNAWEWCADWYGEDYYGQSPLNDPSGPPKGSHRVIRGGSWYNTPWSCRSANRYAYAPDSRTNMLGFRLACEIPLLP